MNWHSLQVQNVWERLRSSPQGLEPAEALARLGRHGPNTLPAARREGPWRRLLRQFDDVLIYILLLAALVTGVMQEWVETGVIMAVVVINAFIGFLQEGRAEQAMHAIRQMLSPVAHVLREGLRRTVDACDLVPGDVVVLEAGERVPADVRLFEVYDFRADEAMLTGESEPVDKAPEPVDEDAPLGDRRSMAFSGTLAVRGTARGVVVETGPRTQVGRIGELVGEVEALTTPLVQKVNAFGRWLALIIAVITLLVFLWGWLAGDYSFAELFMIAVSLAVAALPEGLPAIVTVTLALGVRRMAAHHAIVRRLPAVETLGAVTVICTDKTGTLTRNEMTAEVVRTARVHLDCAQRNNADAASLEAARDPVVRELLEVAVLCSEAALQMGEDGQWRAVGEPSESALVLLGARLGVRATELGRGRQDMLPFDSTRKYMAVLDQGRPGQPRAVLVKGAPERILELCQWQATPEGHELLERDFWEEQLTREAASGRRLMAMATMPAGPHLQSLSTLEMDRKLTLLGMVGLWDPPRPEAIQAVARAQRAGVAVKMITGDHALTARSIGDAMNIGRGRPAITGRELDAASDQELEQIAQAHDVFARTSPEHKLRLVEALQRSGEVVAMTGDGVNDAPALRRADVGVAMGIKGAEASRQAAEMVLADDNFMSIERAIHEGRTIYDNLRKTFLFLLPTNGAQALTVMVAVLAGLPHLPLTPVQILWINMITAVTLALALAFEPAEDDVMERPPRNPQEPLVSAWMLGRIALVAVLIAAAALGVFAWEVAQGATLEVARTGAVNSLAASQLAYLFNSRYMRQSSLRWPQIVQNRVALGVSAIMIVFQALFTYLPVMHRLFGTQALALTHFGPVLLAAIGVFLLVELEKFAHRQWVARKPRRERERGTLSQRPAAR